MFAVIKNKFLKLVMLGCSNRVSEADNRITIFTNTIVIFGLLMGVVMSVQLPYFGVPIKYMTTIIVLTSIAGIVLYLNSKEKKLSARLLTLLFGFIAGWNGTFIFGKSFNGYYVFFVCIVYSVLAFSRNKVQLRLALVVAAIINLVAVDWFFHSGVPTVSNLDSRDFSFQVLWVDTLLYSVWIAIMVWVEKTKADKYEESLREALNVIQREKQKIQIIFDSVNSGIVTVDKALVVGNQFSAHSLNIFADQKIAGSNLFDLLFKDSDLNENQLAMLKTTLDFSLGEDSLNWDLNADKLPKEICISRQGQRQYLSISWSPVLEDDIVSSFVLSIEDITKIKLEEERKKEKRENEERMQLLLTCVMNFGLLQVREFITNLSGEVGLLESRKFSKHHTLRDLHSLKGEARLMALSKLASHIHDVESLLVSEDNQLFQSTSYAEFVSYSQKLINSGEMLFTRIADSAEKSWSLFNYVGGLKKKLQAQVEKSHFSIQLGRFSFDDGVDVWPENYRKSIQTILLHGIQNSVDHGYLIPENRDPIQITVHAREDSSHYYLEIEDFGSGLDLEKIKQKAEKIKSEQGLQYDQLEDILFVDQVSTADVTTLSSGRGVGLSAVKFEAEKLGGKVTIKNCTEHKGVRLTVQLPKQLKQAVA